MFTFEYLYTRTAMAELQIDDIGNCAIQICDDRGKTAFMVIKTVMGKTRMFKFGPYQIDLYELPNETICSYEKIDFSQNRLQTEIRSFLNSRGMNVTQAMEIPIEEAFAQYRDLCEYMRNI